jgi:predicted nucleic acid-binding protein
MAALVDVNVLLAFLTDRHTHNKAARQWLDQQTEDIFI